ncbi:MAG: DUF998 domain-containing protein [Candidatus Methanarcanum hacksteinii]|nr:DUF998 domain-containing protein [Candidatus Methanarcanum hacksteinii]
MDLKKYGMSPYIAISLVGILCFLSGIVIAGCNEVGWDPWVNTLSDLGVSDSSLISSTFNISCYIAGICVFIFGLGLCVFSKDSLQKIGGMSIMVGGCGLFLVGAMTLSNVTMHNIATGLFCIPLVIGIILVTLHHFAIRNPFIMKSSIVVLLVTLIQWPIFTGALSEIASILCAIGWWVTQFLDSLRFKAAAIASE